MDLSYGAVYCFLCGDYVYDEEFEMIARQQNKDAAKTIGQYRIFIGLLKKKCPDGMK